METTIIGGLIYNAALLMLLATAYDLFLALRLPRTHLGIDLVKGLLFGAVALVGMLYPVTLVPGVIFDGRTVLVGMAGLFAGPPGAAMAAAMTAAYRIWLGGQGVLMGVATILTAAVIGSGFYLAHRAGKVAINVWTLVVFGLVVHALAITWALVLPVVLRVQVWREVALPYLTVLPAVSVLFGLLLQHFERRADNERALRESQSKLLQAQYFAMMGDFEWEVATGKVTWSDSMCRLLRYEPDEISDFKVMDKCVHYPDDRARIAQWLQDALNSDSETLGNNEYRLVRKDGAVIHVQTNGSITRENGKAVRVLGICLDITEHKQAEIQLQLAASVFANTLEGIVITDADNRILNVNPSFTRITGYSRREVLGYNPRLLASGRHDKAFYARMWTDINEQGFWHGEVWNRRKNGEIYVELLSISAIRDKTNNVRNYIAVFSDISQLKAHQAELERIAYYDHLTGVPNRRLLVDRLDQAIARTQRSGLRLAVCYLDLDGFKPINDRYGHEVGDQVLIAVAAALKRIQRGYDTIARLGGDEFVLLFTELSPNEDYHALLDRVLETIRQPIRLRGVTHRVSASIGVTLYPPDTGDTDRLLRHADQAMYRAKEAGKDNYHFHTEEYDSDLLDLGEQDAT